MNVSELIIRSGVRAIESRLERVIREYGVCDEDMRVSFAILGSIICLDELAVGSAEGTPFSFVFNKKPPLISKLRPYHFVACYESGNEGGLYEIYPQGIRERFSVRRFRDRALVFSEGEWDLKLIGGDVKAVAVAAREVRRRLQNLGFRKFARWYRGGDLRFRNFVELERAALLGQVEIMKVREYPEEAVREIVSDSEFDARVIAAIVTSQAYLNRSLAEITATLTLEP